MPAAAPSHNAWRRRLYLPNYQVQEAARYARIAPQTIVQWQKGNRGALAPRPHRDALSYLELVEVAVVAALRNEGVALWRIREAREYLASTLKSEYPFAQYRFKTDGRRLFIDFALSREGQKLQQGFGRLVARSDLASEQPAAIKTIKMVPVNPALAEKMNDYSRQLRAIFGS